MADRNILVFRIKPSRLKAKEIAMLETRSVLSFIPDVEVIDGGPLSCARGTFAAFVPAAVALETLLPELSRLGYVEQADQWEELPGKAGEKGAIKWKGRFYKAVPLYREDKEAARRQAPDKRRFLLPDPAGQVRSVSGYRGDGTETGRRALPVEDCRALLNIAGVRKGQKVLDPFAGGGGIVWAAKSFGLDVFSSDIDPQLQYGLRDYGAHHTVACVEQLPFPDASFDAVVTEAPFHASATPAVLRGLAEMARVIIPAGTIVMMVAQEQADPVREKAGQLNLNAYADKAVDRKGTPVHIFTWRTLNKKA